MSQDALPPVQPLSKNPSTGQLVQQRIPSPGRQRRGWYPRWWILSAFFCGFLIGLFYLIVPNSVCLKNASALPLCQLNSWNDWRQIVAVAAVWLIFLLGWLVAYTFGLGPIEIPSPKKRSRTVQFFSE
jgi:hypothetical protein